MGCSVTFMAKPDASQAGSSSHLHVSLWADSDGELTNSFPGDGDLGGIACSDVFRWFLGGWMRYVPELMVCYAPTVNSYKRFPGWKLGPHGDGMVAGQPHGRLSSRRRNGPSLRIECRIPGADVNPYLAYSAVIASGLAGIEQQIEPPPAFIGDVYAASDEQMLPVTLEEAVREFREQRPGPFSVRRGRRRSLRALLHHRGKRLSQRRDRLGAHPLLRAHLASLHPPPATLRPLHTPSPSEPAPYLIRGRG